MPNNFLKFLGTSGARFVMIKQLRSSGGIWVNSEGTNVLIDPGPGSIVRCAKSRPRLDPTKLDGIILTHRHLDHSGDINVMIEAMTEGGFKKRGVVFCPADAVKKDPVILDYIKSFPQQIRIINALKKYSVGNINFYTSMRHIHPVETYGLKFKVNGSTIGLLSDTRYFDGLSKFYKNTDILIICVVFYEKRPGIDHLCLSEAEKIIKMVRPGKAILTHFGLTMLKAGLNSQSKRISGVSGIEVLSAYDGMRVDL